MSRRLMIRDYVGKDEAWHFARIELGQIEKSSLHDHDFPELLWIESGNGVHWINGDLRKIEAGTLIFVRPDDFHTVGTARQEEKVTVCNLAFPARAWVSIMNRHLKGIDWYAAGTPKDREHVVSPQVFDFLRRARIEMALVPRSRLMLERFFLNLWVALEEARSSSLAQAPCWLMSALKRVESERLFREGPQALTRLSSRSQEHVVREARRWLKKTPTALINEMRMRHAATCLTTTQTEIIDICFDCGLENVGYFYALFQQTYGLTPRQYRLKGQSIVRPVL